MLGSWVLNEIWIIDLSSSLVGVLMSPSKFFFSNEAHLTVTVFVIALCFSHHACCLLCIWAKLTVAFTFTSFPFNLYTCVIGCGCGFGLEQKFWRIDGFDEKKARIGGFAYPYSLPFWKEKTMSSDSKLQLKLTQQLPVSSHAYVSSLTRTFCMTKLDFRKWISAQLGCILPSAHIRILQ